jgi:N-acyl-D-amino-acid deacylase
LKLNIENWRRLLDIETMFLLRNLAFLLIFSAAVSSQGAAPGLIIRNGLVIDGSGSPGKVQDIAVSEGKIVEIGSSLPLRGNEEIDAIGLVVCPGFIDVHSHAEDGLLEQADNHNNILQGITTFVGGNCGDSPIDLDRFFDDLRAKGVTTNVACLIGHNRVRREVMGMRARGASEEEMESMKRLVRRAMESGALGLSTGLLYPPGTFSTYEEVLELAKVVGEYQGIYASHIRSEEQEVWKAVEEALRVGQEAGIRTQISHIKLAAEAHWGMAQHYSDLLSEARARGVRVMADQYPYRAGSATLQNILPRWSLDGGREAFLKRVSDPEDRERIIQGILEGRLASARGTNRGEIVFISRCRAHPEYEGKNLVQICRENGLEATPANAAEMAIRLLEDGPVSAVNFLMDEADVQTFLRDPHIMISTDGGVTRFGVGMPHPRNYGTYPRLLGHYVREKGILGLEDAIRKSTSLPAKQMGFSDRGSIALGNWADLVVFDPENIIDRATFQKPHQYPTGITYVIVNGIVTVKNGHITGARPGQVLRGPGWSDEQAMSGRSKGDRTKEIEEQDCET